LYMRVHASPLYSLSLHDALPIWRRFRRPRLDQPLELRTAVVCRRRARFYIGVNDLEATRRAPAFTLPSLVGDRYVMLGLPRGRRSEEHTSELQSRENLVCRLLLE